MLLAQLLDPEVRADPYPLYRRILDECPTSPSPSGGVVLARHADCAAVLRDRRASNDERVSTAFRALAGTDLAALDANDGRSFLFLDPPDHTRLRRLVAKAFTPRVIEALRPRVQRWVDELLDAAAERGSLELVEDLAYPLPITVICELLGVPSGDRALFRVWSAQLVRSMDPRPMITAEDQARMLAAIEALNAYFDDLIAARRAAPGDDLLSALIAVCDGGDQLSHTELRATGRLLLIAGHETTVNLIANGMLALLRHPEQLDRLRDDPGLAPSAVEEVLRYDPPVQISRRHARAPLHVGGAEVEAGRELILLLAAAGHDPEAVSDPQRFDIGRRDAHHLAFGAGIHFCLGAPLARLEGQIALATLARRLVAPQLESDPPPYREHIVLRGPARLPITFTALNAP